MRWHKTRPHTSKRQGQVFLAPVFKQEWFAEVTSLNRSYKQNAGRHLERNLTRCLKRIFDEEANAIPQEQIDRVLAPVLKRIASGEFSPKPDKPM